MEPEMTTVLLTMTPPEFEVVFAVLQRHRQQVEAGLFGSEAANPAAYDQARTIGSLNFTFTGPRQ